MPLLFEALKLKGNPFEHYVAETEPNISEYAVKPPYFETVESRAKNTSTCILFGDRGAGKSATRLTVYSGLWKAKSGEKRVPLVVNMTDFSTVVDGKKLVGLSEAALLKDVAFVVIESLLTWLSSLSDDDRAVFLGAMNDDESSLCYSLLRDYYLPRPAAKRSRSAREAMLLLNQAFLARNQLWVERRWDSIANLFGKIVDVLTNKYVGESGPGEEAAALMKKKEEEGFDSVLLLHRLVELAQIYDFSGVVVLVDKVDETGATSNSADQTAALIYPLLSHVQLMEVKGFSWIFFLWAKLKGVFESERPIRLDKIAHATVSWDDTFFSLMLEKRVQFFSDHKFGFSGLFANNLNVENVRSELVRVAMRSPRELIRLMDVIVREHDIVHSAKPETVTLVAESIDNGIDKYVMDVVTTVYGERLLAQIFRLNRVVFTNKDVQTTFRIGSQSARNRIQNWENAG